MAHFPQHRDVYELCDSLGIIVMDEIPAWKTSTPFLNSTAGRAKAGAYLREMIRIRGNHTCVAMWSLGNEFATFRTSVAEYVRDVAAVVKAADPSRLTTYCSYFYRFDKAYGYVDVISINEYFGWYLGSLDMLAPMLKSIRAAWPNRPIIVTELGAQATLGLRNENARLSKAWESPVRKDLSEDHQALYLGAHLDTLWNHRDVCVGALVWCYADFMANRLKPAAESSPEGIDCMGVVDEGRNRRLSYEAVKRRFAIMACQPVADTVP
jgi:hypothetical protein